MSAADPLAVLEVNERNELEALLLEFDESWTLGSFKQTARRVASHPSQQYGDLALAELAKVDLQRSWSAGNGRTLDEYLDQFPSLGTTDTVAADLVVAEFEARSNIDADLVLASYESRFPKQFSHVQELVSKLSESGVADSLRPKRTEAELGQASIDTSRIENLRDTKDGKKRDPVLELPIEFGRYRILKGLGAGAMGKVYLAHDSQLDRQVALKTPSFSGSGDDDLVTRFYREARAAAKIQHRNICPIYDVGEIDGRHFITMAFIKGRCMSEFIKPDRLPPQRTSAILVQRLAVALAEAHNHNVIHRDLKPANIMIDLKKEPIVMDFGLARQMDIESRVTQSGMAVGTPAYMSPEQIRGEIDEVGPSADIYALGVILYELLSGQLPFRGPIAKVVYGIVNETPTALSQIRSDIDPELEEVCSKMMAKRRDDRYSSMVEVAAALKAYIKGNQRSSTLDTSRPEPTGTSNDNRLSETGALNAFFAAQVRPESRETVIEPSRQSMIDLKSPNAQATGRSGGNNRNRRWGMLAGFAGGMSLLFGVVIYFNGGKIVLDSDSSAVVDVDAGGNVTVRPKPGDDTGEVVAKEDTAEAPLESLSVQQNTEIESGFFPLFPSDSLDSWNGLPERWSLENGELRGSAPEGVKLSSNTVIFQDKDYRDFELRFEAMLAGSSRKDGPNSGIQFRSNVLNRTEFKVGGPQFDIGGRFWGGLWGENTTGLMFQPSGSLIDRTIDRRGWNRYRLRVEGDRVSAHINDEQIFDRDFPGMPEKGIVGFQLHRGKVMSVRFRNVRIKELSSHHRDKQSSADSATSSAANHVASINPKVEILNEWDHGALNASNWYLATLSPDGRRVAFRLRQGPLTISDCESKESLNIPIEMQDAISLAYSSDGRLIATGHEDKKIRLWNAGTFEPMGEPFESPIEPRVPWVHLSADGTKLIAMANDHSKLKGTSTFLTWEISSRKLISRFQAGMDDQRLADSIDASADGRLVAVISLRGGPTLWDTTTGKHVPVEFEFDKKLAGMKRIAGMDLSADGSRLAYGTVWGSSSYAAILDTSSGKELWNSGKQKGRVHCVQFTNDGKWLASTAGRDGAHQLSLWDVNTGSEIERWTYQHNSDNENGDRVKFLSFSDDGSKLLLTGGHMPVVVWTLHDNVTNELPAGLISQPSSSKLTPKLVNRSTSTEDVALEQRNPSTGSTTDDRDIATQIVEFGGSVQLVGSSKWIWTLPEGEIRVQAVSFFRKQKQFDDGHIALLGQLPDLQHVVFYPNEMTDDGIATLAEMENVVENVTRLSFLRMGLGPKGLAALAKLKQLDTLTLHHTALINDDLKLLSKFQSLKDLTLSQQNHKKFGPAFLTDECMKHLNSVPNLRKLTLIGDQYTDTCLVTIPESQIAELWLGTPSITDDGIKQLREKRPRLGVTRFKQTNTESELVDQQ